MDHVFMRSDTGYDAVALALRDDQGLYQVYILGDEHEREKWIFSESNEDKLKEKIQAWCRNNLLEEDRMVALPKPLSEEVYAQLKKFLQINNIPYEVRKRLFHVRNGDVHKVEFPSEGVISAPNDGLMKETNEE